MSVIDQPARIKASTLPQITVCVPDKAQAMSLRRSQRATIIRHPDLTIVKHTRNIFVLTSMMRLVHVAEFVHAANSQHHLRALFVEADTKLSLLPRMLDRAGIRTLRNMVVHSGPLIPNRVIAAWLSGAQEQLIAEATVFEDKLLVLNCAMQWYEVGFEEIRALASLSIEERKKFTIADDGSYLHWEARDIHIDVDTVRMAVDKEWQEKALLERLLHDTKVGRAISLLRRRHGLKQSDIPGLSDRQVRRIEAGERTTVEALECLAASHDLSLKEYLNQVAQFSRQVE